MNVEELSNLIGVNIAITQGSEVSNNPIAANTLFALRYLGIDQVRAAALAVNQSGNAPTYLDEYTSLAEGGIAFDMVFNFLNSNSIRNGDALDKIKSFEIANPGSVIAIEGPNEIDLYPPTYEVLAPGQTPGQGTIYTGLDAATRIVSEFVSGAVARDFPSGIDFYSYSGTPIVDTPAAYTNIHPYIQSGNDYQPGQKFETAIQNNNARAVVKPLVFTEFGYSSVGLSGSTTIEGITDKTTISKFLLNAWMDVARLNAINPASAQIHKMYFFQLFNEAPGIDPAGHANNFGLFNFIHNSDKITDLTQSAKPQAVAIHNMSSILTSDSGVATGTVKAPTTSTAGVYTLDIDKAGGVKDFVLWAEPDIWDQVNNVTIAAPEITAAVKFGGAVTVRIYDPMVRATPIETYTNLRSLSVTVTDHPVIVEVLSAAPLIKGTRTSDTLAGTSGNDALDGLGGDDSISGGDGNDFLRGGGGVDIVYGGAGSDVFAYKGASDASGKGPLFETIMDFQVDTQIVDANFPDIDFVDATFTGDIIDLSDFDAQKGVTGNQAFVLGGSAFTGVRGELIQHVETINGQQFLVIEGDTTADLKGDLIIHVAMRDPVLHSDAVTGPLGTEYFIL